MEFACRIGISEFIVIRQTDQPTGLFHIPVGCTPHSQLTEYSQLNNMISKRRLVVEMQYAHSGVDRQYPCRSIYPLACDVTEISSVFPLQRAKIHVQAPTWRSTIPTWGPIYNDPEIDIQDINVSGLDCEIPAIILTRKGGTNSEPRPSILFLHGGGRVMGNVYVGPAAV
ncbi:Efflux pump FUBT, partial [Fusarium oxysporum f. sp. albedinis]